ncbi:long-chain fatty acid--CoA ligase [Sulfobacillus harzensis]|uniref:Long-chain fatty acid--CoA ligase n=1 Tax=Sulfobacillus harzensis TaxID=2729629 RepID=A0A7Y0L0C3_9FIRM|nr:long-chain fatty acid--CoA ligase [Sulfobacillus harzensis]NMP20890.1 long-chain fatty acid--CoA ligase [Sulfobacillus harzensis]
MMKTPLLLRHLFEYAETYFPSEEIVSRGYDNTYRFSYAEYAERTRRLSGALSSLGVGLGDRVGTFLWNDHVHLEAYFGVPAMGAVLHTINIRLAPEQIAYIINHAEDRVLVVDRTLWPILAPLAPQLKTVKAFLFSGPGQLPDVPGALDYEAAIQQATPMSSYPDLDENHPLGMCYTSATTGNPKGVVYTHRGIYLHSLTLGLANTMGLSMEDAVLPVVPMFHVNAWGLPFAALWYGAKIVLPGPAPTPRDLVDLMKDEKVTVAAGVPTVWLGLSRVLEQTGERLFLREAVCGGSAAPEGLIRRFEEEFHIPFVHAYGMTETSPIASVARLKRALVPASDQEKMAAKASQGLLVPGLTVRLERDGQEVPWDGESAGEMCLQGPWIADEYYRDARSEEAFVDGWLHTGDVATIDKNGYIHIVDRTRDVIKSGGEWISSVDLENALMSHPAVFEAAVVGVPHPKWDERPLAFVVLKEGATASKEELLALLAQKFAKWQLPDDILYIDEVPKTTVGKFLKRALRDQYQHYLAGERDA